MNPSYACKTTFPLIAMFVLATIAAPAQTFSTLFWLRQSTGGTPLGALVQGTDGNLYGTALYAGAAGDGTVFKMTPGGTVTLVHSFHGTADGANPSGLVLSANGNLYGTTEAGGASASCTGGCGTVFGFTSTGTIFLLHSFDSSDGQSPVGGLTLGPDGNFYGTTQIGGSGCQCGTVFQITPAGAFNTLHTFSTSDGASPQAPLVLGSNGILYGTTSAGGTSGDGTVFTITTSGTFTTLHNFDSTHGSSPVGAMVQAADGNFYGTTYSGGSSGHGTVFLISPGGHTFKSLYSFTGGTDGGNPNSALVLGADGNFYGGSDKGGGGSNSGELFKITPSGALTGLAAFDGTEGGGRLPTLMQDTNGTFFGTTYEDGGYPCSPVGLCGTTFSLSTALGPFITTVPPMRVVGGRVLILGQGLLGTTSVTFNGVDAVFTINSDTEITATVPAGATKGFVQVTTPSGTLTTKVIFMIG